MSVGGSSAGSDWGGSTGSLREPLLLSRGRSVPNVPSKRQRFIMYTPFASATAEASSFPHPTKCIHCARQLRAREARWGTGLCDGCYGNVDKVCQCCHSRLTLRQLHWNSGLCNRCYDSCEKQCRLCETKLDLRNQAMRGLCDMCATSFEHNCRTCQRKLGERELRWGSRLCNNCYDASDKTCKTCKSALIPTQLRWGTGLCDYCYESAEKACSLCDKAIDPSQLHWGTGMCDACCPLLSSRRTPETEQSRTHALCPPLHGFSISET